MIFTCVKLEDQNYPLLNLPRATGGRKWKCELVVFNILLQNYY